MTDPVWLGWLCANVEVLRRLDAPEAERLLAEVRDGADVGARLSALSDDLDLPPTGDVRRGPGPALDPTRAPVPGWPSAEVLVCPGGRCGRTSVRRPGVAVPSCAVDDVRLRLVRR